MTQAGATLVLLILTSLTLMASRVGAEEDTPEGGSFDYYALVLSWSPTYCATDEAERRNEPHCDRKSGHFTLHGLWPQYFEGWPSDCWRGRRPWVPEKVIEEMRDILPSKGLVITNTARTAPAPA